MQMTSSLRRRFLIIILSLFVPSLLYAQFEPALSITPEQDGQQIRTVSISSDGRWIVTGTNQPILWDAQTGEKIRTYHGHDGLLPESVNKILGKCK